MDSLYKEYLNKNKRKKAIFPQNNEKWLFRISMNDVPDDVFCSLDGEEFGYITTHKDSHNRFYRQHSLRSLRLTYDEYVFIDVRVARELNILPPL